jgi:hypothetical protein
VQVRHDEGGANRIGPEPCVDTRKRDGEASVGETIGQPLSRVRIPVPGADAVAKVEGKTSECDIARTPTTRRGRRTWHVGQLFVREPGDPMFDHQQVLVVRIVKARSRNR